MGENPGVLVVGLFIAFVILGALFVVLQGGDVAAFTDSAAAIGTPIIFIAVAVAAISIFRW